MVWENITPSTRLPLDFCAGIGPLQLGVVLVLIYVQPECWTKHVLTEYSNKALQHINHFLVAKKICRPQPYLIPEVAWDWTFNMQPGKKKRTQNKYSEQTYQDLPATHRQKSFTERCELNFYRLVQYIRHILVYICVSGDRGWGSQHIDIHVTLEMVASVNKIRRMLELIYLMYV